MTKIRCSLASIAVLAVVSVPLSAQTKMGKEFLIDVNSPFVYVMFDHIGPGTPRNSNEPRSRIWLRLRNNCRIAIVVRADGVPENSPKNEVGLEYEVVANSAFNVSLPATDAHKPANGEPRSAHSSDKESDEIPRGYMEEFASLVTIGPGEEILFSIPVNHLSDRWHMEIPFDFELPSGKGPLRSNTVGLPVMRVDYTLWDLPRNSQAEILRK